MGGLYGNAAATALEGLPPEARGLMSGLLQQGVCMPKYDPFSAHPTRRAFAGSDEH
jgi:hypothetical protein